MRGQTNSTDATGAVIGVLGTHNATSGIQPGVQGSTSSLDLGAAGVKGLGMAGLGSGVWGDGAANGVFGYSDAGVGVRGDTLDGFGVFGKAGGTGTALVAVQAGAGRDIAVFQTGVANKARIDKNGVGYFNGGTVNSGADLAEAFDVNGDRSGYAPGDVLVISTRGDRLLEKASAAHSTLVAGVYATKPGVLLTDLGMDADGSRRVPLGIVGVIPTKVSGENGPICRGDLLVTAATPGHAMKAGATPMLGSVLGKALQDFAGPGTGMIEVLVNVK